jgi:hypothetical protein
MAFCAFFKNLLPKKHAFDCPQPILGAGAAIAVGG